MLTIEEPFGALVQELRLQAKIRQRQDMPGAMKDVLGPDQVVSLRTLENLERHGTQRASPDTVKLLCRFFFRRGVLKSPDDVEYFCFRALYRVKAEFQHGDVLLALEPMRVGSVREVTQLVMSYVGSPGGGKPAEANVLAKGLQALSEMLATLAPPPPGLVELLEQRVDQLLEGEPRRADLDRLANELRHAYDDAPALRDKFRLAYLHARIDEVGARYVDALTWSTHAFAIAEVLSLQGAAVLKKLLADLCEGIAAAELNIGARENWDRASLLFEKAIALREEMRRELGLEIKISEQRDLDGLFQVARYYSHVGHHDEKGEALKEAETRYRHLLARPQAKANRWFCAQVYKELADNCRFAGDEKGMYRNFRKALKEYEASKRRSYRGDPREETEYYLNVGYCYRRLRNERRAWKEISTALDIAHRQRDRRRVAYASLQLARSPESFARDDNRAFHALLAHEMMRQSGAEADRRQAEIVLNDLCEEYTRDEIGELDASLRASPFAVYLE